MPKYFQCSRCKKLKELPDDHFDGGVIVNNIMTSMIKSEYITETTCLEHGRRMREFSKDQYDHEVIQREHVENSGPAPVDTEL